MASISQNSANNIIPSIKKSSDDFSFVDTLSQAVTNKEFLIGKLQLDANEKTPYSYLWEVLSAVGQDIGETLYSNVLNYIDNVCNIAVCKISALKSMLKAYGIKYTLFDNLDIFPTKIADMLDLLSINKRYLKDTNVFDRKFISQLIDENNNVAVDMYSNNKTASMLYQYFRTRISMSDDSNQTLPFLGNYALSNDYSYDDISCNTATNEGINICREYVYGPIHKLYYDFDKIGELPSNYVSANCLKQLSADFSATYKIKKFNVVLDNELSAYQKDFYYGLFECNKTINYYWKDYQKRVLSGEISRPHKDELIGIMYNFEETMNSYSDERVSFGPIFRDLHVENLQTSMFPLNVEDEEIANKIALQKTAKVSSLVNYDRVGVLSGITTTEFSFQFENGHNNVVDDIIIEDKNYYDFLSSIYYCHLSNVCNIAYINDKTAEVLNAIKDGEDRFASLVQPIYSLSTVSAEFFPYKTNYVLSSALENKEFKQQNSIDLRFDEKKIVNDIEVGADFIDNYEGAKRKLIENEIETRNQILFDMVDTLSVSDVQQSIFNTTRTNYYRKELVKQYVRFVEQCNYANESNIFLSSYNIDSNYMIVDHQNNKYKQLINNVNGKLQLDYQMLQNVAKFLADFTLYISNIREKLKSQAVRYYMKGTFNLLSFIINEYLIEFSKNNNVLKYIFDEDSALQAKYIEELSSSDVTKKQILDELAEIKSRLSAHMYVNVNVVEYDDLTEYYNLSTDTTRNAANNTSTNERYWETKQQYGQFEIAEIQNFYIETLKNKANLKADQFRDFLNVLYDIGADTSYVDASTGNFIVDGIHINRNGEIDNQNKVQQSFSYMGTEIGNQPYYNNKNQTHPTYQVHPYLYNFVESMNSVYSVENAFKNGLADDIIAENAVTQIKTNIGKYGQVVDIWKNNAYDFSGYRTSYEVGQHASNINNGKIVECADYDGMFYPPALNEYITAYKVGKLNSLTADIINRCGDFYTKYYKHLNLVNEELDVLAKRLVEYAADITSIADEKQDADEAFDIYKYATDKYGNAYGLYKKYSLSHVISPYLDDEDTAIDQPITYAMKENTLGSLWIRLKDSPIAFPAFAGDNPIFQKKIKNENEEVHVSWQLKDETLAKDNMCYFYDMEFDITKQVMFLNCWPLNYVINSTNDKSGTAISYAAKSIRDNTNVLKTKEYSMVLICCLKQEQDSQTNERKLYITHDDIQNIDAFSNIYNRLIQLYKKSQQQLVSIYDLAQEYFDDEQSNKRGKLQLNSFLGFYKSVQSIDAVYAKKNYIVYKDESATNAVHIVPDNNIVDKTKFSIQMSRYTLNSINATFEHGPYTINLNTFANGKCADYSIATGTIRFNYSNDDLVFGFLTKKDVQISATNYVGKNVGKGEMQYPNATKGYAFPMSPIKETNSFDAFDKYVTIVDAKILNDDIVYSDVNIFNLNSDASYIPQYPGLDGKNLLYKTNKYGNAKSQRYKSVELLGFSKKISDLVSKIDPNADMNYDVDMLQKIKESIPGRVYEDYDMTLDELLFIESNPQLNYGNSVFDKGNAFEWKISLDKFTIKELAGVDLLLFNSRNAGKNAYYSGAVSSLIDAASSSEEVIAENYISSDVDCEIPLSVSVAEVYVAGTFNFFGIPVNKSDTNHLDNIQKIQIEFVNNDPSSITPQQAMTTKSQSYIIVRFYKNDITKRSYIYADTVKTVMYNKFNLRIYEFYHYFDERGIVKYDGEQDYNHAYVDISDLVLDNYSETMNEHERLQAQDYSYTDVVSTLVPIDNPPSDARYEDRFNVATEERLFESQRIYLKDISLSSYNYLSDVIVLKDKQNISYKYSEEDVFNLSNALFYYPGYNKIYPNLNTSMFSMLANQAIDTLQLFDQTNLYITQMENNSTFADKVGNVDIPVEYNETECLRVFEDYDRVIDSQDPQLLSCVHFITTDDSIEYPTVNISGTEFISIDARNYANTLDESIVNVQGHGYYGILTEQLSSDFEFDKITFTVTKENTDFKTLLDIYTSYEVMPGEKIRLFFNYYNFINSPFIELAAGKPTIKAIEGTYLKLDPGESGLLDIVVQFKAYYGDNLYGIKTGTLITYKIFNVSDDKPKFVIYKMSEIAKGALSERSGIDADAIFSMVNLFIDLDDDSNITADGKICAKVKFMVDSVDTIAPGATYKIDYKLDELTFKNTIGNVPGFTCIVEEDPDNEDYGHITLTSKQSMNIKSIILEGKTVQAKTTIVATQVASYDMSIIDVKANSVEGADISFVTTNGSIMFGYQVLLRKEVPQEDALVAQERTPGRPPSFIVTRQA